jgi:DNA-binding YbaB/EbfC family protein
MDRPTNKRCHDATRHGLSIESKDRTMFPNLGMLGNLLGDPAKLREQMERVQAELAAIRAEGTAGGGMVTAVFNGKLDLVRLRIDPQALSNAANDPELLEDLITAAIHQGMARAREEVARTISSLAGGMPIPGLNQLFTGGF